MVNRIEEDTPLHVAVRTCGLEKVQYLVEKLGADVNARGKEGTLPIHDAAWTGNNKVVNYLLGLRQDMIEAKDYAGWTPLFWAAVRSSTVAICNLHVKGANLEHTDLDGCNVLHRLVSFALCEDRINAISFFLENGKPSVEQRNNDGQTVLDLVRSSDEFEIFAQVFRAFGYKL